MESLHISPIFARVRSGRKEERKEKGRKEKPYLSIQLPGHAWPYG